MNKITTISFGQESFTLSPYIGIVKHHNQRRQTIISLGTSSTTDAVGNVYTRTSTWLKELVHDTVHLKDEFGTLKTIETINWYISCEKDHQLVFALLERDADKAGNYIAVKNLYTGHIQLGNPEMDHYSKRPRRRKQGERILMFLVFIFIGSKITDFIFGSPLRNRNYLNYVVRTGDTSQFIHAGILAFIFMPIPYILYLLFLRAKKRKYKARKEFLTREIQNYLNTFQ